MTDYDIGWAGQLMRWLRFAMNLVLVNLLFVAGTIAGLGIFGVFPAAVAAAILLGRLRYRESGEHLVRDFAVAYRAQFWHLNRIALVFWAALVLLALNAVSFQTIASQPMTGPVAALSGVLFLLFVAAAVVTLLASASAVVICTRYRSGVIKTWRYAFMLPLVSPVMSAAVLVSGTAMLIVMVRFGFLFPLIGLSGPLFVCGWLIDRRLAALDPAAAEEPGPSAARVHRFVGEQGGRVVRERRRSTAATVEAPRP